MSVNFLQDNLNLYNLYRNLYYILLILFQHSMSVKKKLKI